MEDADISNWTKFILASIYALYFLTAYVKCGRDLDRGSVHSAQPGDLIIFTECSWKKWLNESLITSKKKLQTNFVWNIFFSQPLGLTREHFSWCILGRCHSLAHLNDTFYTAIDSSLCTFLLVLSAGLSRLLLCERNFKNHKHHLIVEKALA